MSTAKFETWLNPSGTENYKCRAWVNFNGQGTVAIRASGNVSSITDNGLAVYTVNFTNAMPDANYAIVGTAGLGSMNDTQFVVEIDAGANPTTTSFRINVGTSSTISPSDPSLVSVAIFR